MYDKNERPTATEFANFCVLHKLTSKMIHDDLGYNKRTVDSWRSWRRIPYPAWKQIVEKYS